MGHRYQQILKGIAALVATAVLVLGTPVGLIAYVGWPLPTRVPTFEEMQLAFRSGIDPQLLIKTLAVVVWVTWSQLVVALAVEFVAVVRGKTARRAPVLAGMQAAAARLVATITLIAASLGPLRAPAAGAVPLSALIAVPIETSQVIDTDTPPSPEPDQATAATRRHTAAQPHYTTSRFDTLWGIAERALGDGRRWQEIRDLNLGSVTADGNLITSTTERVAPGSDLLLPADATNPASDQTGTHDETPTDVTVERGDHFWSIAETALYEAWGRQPTSEETAAYWRQVIEVNRDRLLPPGDPDLIYPGQVFGLPPIPDEPSTAEPTQPIGLVTNPATDHVTVKHGDHFWRIAENALTEAWERQPSTEETATYWRQVIEVNQDRLLPPGDPDLIYPGQVFRLPAVPQDPTVSVREESADLDEQAEGSHTVEQPGEEPTTPDIPPDREGETPTPHQQTSPNSVPPVTPPAEQPQDPESSEDANIAAESGPGTAEPVQADDPDDNGNALPPIAGQVAGLGLLAAGIIALIDRLRRNQLRQRKPGTIPTPPPVTATRTEATLRAAAAPAATELIDLALRALAHQITDSHTPPPQVVGVHLSSDTVRLLLWGPHHDPPPGWRVDDDGHSWALSTSIDVTHLHLLADATPAPYPALVTVGHDEDAQLLLDLEYLGAVQITGDPGDVAATCYTMATELAASPIADILDVVCVGFGHDLQHLERITVVDKLTDILPAVEQKNTATTAQDITPFEGRLAPWGGDTWAPLIILDPNPDRPEGADRLLAAAHRGRAVCAVVGYPTSDRWRLHVTDSTVHIDPLGHTYKRRNLTPTEQAGIADLTRTAKDLDGIPQHLAGEPAPRIQPADHTQDKGDGETDTPDGPFPSAKPTPEIRTLGTVRIEGPMDSLPQPKSLELITYLALHRRGVEADTMMEALWPEQRPDNHRLNNLMHRARRALGADSDGEPFLPHVTDNLYRISPHVGCDLDRLTHHIRSADQAAESDAIEHLQAALGLVEGTPFSGIKNGYGWAHTEGIITHAIVTVDNAAHRLAQQALQADKPEQATWAARKGLAASWACEECYRNLMRAAISEDNQTALDAIYNELTAIVDADQGPDATSWLDPDTIDLYQQHSRNRRRHTG